MDAVGLEEYVADSWLEVVTEKNKKNQTNKTPTVSLPEREVMIFGVKFPQEGGPEDCRWEEHCIENAQVSIIKITMAKFHLAASGSLLVLCMLSLCHTHMSDWEWKANDSSNTCFFFVIQVKLSSVKRPRATLQRAYIITATPPIMWPAPPRWT